MRKVKRAEGDSRGKSGGTRFPGELRETLRQGRWLLTAAETAVSAFALSRSADRPAALWATLAALLLYNALAIVVLRGAKLPRLLVPAIIGLDLVFVLLAARLTGGVQSPFLGLSYLIILAAALWYDLIGGITLGIAASLGAVAANRPGTDFTPLQIALLGNLVPSYLLAGGFTGFLVRRLKLYYERDAAARLRQQSEDQEMQLARTMQAAALPEKPPTVPGLDCAFLTRFAGEIGGDFLLFVAPEPDGKTAPLLGITIGDVSGKGIPAALASTGIAHLLPWLQPLRDPRGALRSLNDDLNERLPGDYYATLLFVEVDADRLCLRTAGHPPALLWRGSEGKVVTADGMPDPPLGMFPTWQGNPHEMLWDVGDVLLLYTDGATETRNADGAQFTAERVAAALAACAEQSAAEIVRCVSDAILAWGTPTDDLTLAVCRRVPLPEA